MKVPASDHLHKHELPWLRWSKRHRGGDRAIDRTPDAAASLALECVRHCLLERHPAADSEGSGEVLLAELGREGASHLLVHAPFIGLGGVPRFLAQRFDGAQEPGRPLRVASGDGERRQLS